MSARAGGLRAPRAALRSAASTTSSPRCPAGNRPAPSLAAHYDSVAAGPGPSDDGAAVAAMLESVRALLTADRLRNDLVLLNTDGEEDGLLGAAAFAPKYP